MSRLPFALRYTRYLVSSLAAIAFAGIIHQGPRHN
jgi:hypothetical protein